jgi:hypothetical protein
MCAESRPMRTGFRQHEPPSAKSPESLRLIASALAFLAARYSARLKLKVELDFPDSLGVMFTLAFRVSDEAPMLSLR